MKSIVIVGASGHGKVIADVAKCVGYEKITFLDDGRTGKVGNYEIAGDTSLIDSFDADFFVAIGSGPVRRRITQQILMLLLTVAPAPIQTFSPVTTAPAI